MSNSEKPKSWKEHKQTIKHMWLVPFIYVEWICEHLSYLLGRWAFLEVLGHAGRLTILVAIIFYFAESGSRRKAKHYQAWQVINAAQGKIGSGGRLDALQDLCRDAVSLAGVNISKAYLPELNLENADLHCAILAWSNFTCANFTGAILYDANFVGASLRYANLTEANLRGANLTGANLRSADLNAAQLIDANLAGANLYETELKGADLRSANLYGADLAYVNFTDANLTEAYLRRTHLTGATLKGANLTRADLWDIERWEEISIEEANIYGVKNPPDGFIEWAKEHGAVIIEDDEEWKKLRQKRLTEK